MEAGEGLGGLPADAGGGDVVAKAGGVDVVEEEAQGVLGGFGGEVDGAVGEVGDASSDIQTLRDARDGIAKADALDSAFVEHLDLPERRGHAQGEMRPLAGGGYLTYCGISLGLARSMRI